MSFATTQTTMSRLPADENSVKITFRLISMSGTVRSRKVVEFSLRVRACGSRFSRIFRDAIFRAGHATSRRQLRSDRLLSGLLAPGFAPLTLLSQGLGRDGFTLFIIDTYSITDVFIKNVFKMYTKLNTYVHTSEGPFI